MKRFDNKIVLVSGAASGIGFATANAFAVRGAHVILADYAADALAQAAKRLDSYQHNVSTALLDITNADAIERLASKVAEKHGALDVLVNNAGIGFAGTFMEHDLQVWRRVFEVNVFGMVNCLRAFLPAMRVSGGKRHVVNVASGVAVAPLPNMAAYVASKAAVRNLGEVLAMELQGSEIGLHTVYPGIINTAIADPRMFGPSATAEQKSRLVNFYRNKGGSADQVAADILRGIARGQAHIFTGPLALSGSLLSHISPSLSRTFAVKTGRKAGFVS